MAGAERQPRNCMSSGLLVSHYVRTEHTLSPRTVRLRLRYPHPAETATQLSASIGSYPVLRIGPILDLSAIAAGPPGLLSWQVGWCA